MKAILGAVGLVMLASPALAQEGHFVGEPVCRDVGTQLACTGKVAGLGETTFTLTVEAPGVATVACANPGQNEDVPGQRTEVVVTGSLTEQTPRNGQFTFRNLSTVAPTLTPQEAGCPNPQWTAVVTDVEFTGDATLTLIEGGEVSDQIVVPVQ